MPKCFTPMVRYYCKYPESLPEGQTAFQKIIPRGEVFANLQEDENYLTRIQDKNYELEKQGSCYRYQLIPCQHCWACQMKYSAEWASRIIWECGYHENNYFITLTYDEEHLPMYETFRYTDEDGKDTIYENDGTWTGTLEPRDVTRFIKKLRKHYEEKGITGIKYFYCGEYGTEEGRPHYHMILMGAPLDMKQFYKFKEDPKHKKLHWKSHELEEYWSEPQQSKYDKPKTLGFVDVAEVEWNCAAYVARYCMKKINRENDARKYAEVGKIKEFIRMSRRPGIGTKYYDEHKEQIYELDEVIQRTIQGKVSSFKPPKAWDRKFKKECPEQWEPIQKSREAAAERNRLLIKEIDKGITDLERLQREADKTITKGNLLKRIAIE